MPVEHYENFPVASFLLPRRLVPAVEAIYAFARSADDIADEGGATPPERLAELERYGNELQAIERGQVPADPLFSRLAAVVTAYGLPLAPMHDLLSAFRQDVLTTRYADYTALLDYCRRSANPVGRLMLELYQAVDERNLQDSDAICTALQLINFWQDVAIDLAKGRIYLPQEDLERHGVTEAELAATPSSPAWRSLMRFEVERARALMLGGAPLVRRLPGRIGWELRLMVQGGLRILEAIERADFDVFGRRPTLAPADWIVVGWRALRM
ncbi:squalene synthase HpnC [Massilia yuzhufengensis]|uniref:Squalene synthase HpnC n=1 Tax=Massilia yuzhufengensis TaxID=1164594 RepID=A0A1I1S5Q5_9BURK|nr:squalene synthase HpnC [Massilia yuzhufengensis]SFD41826.1 squalene synthase HpnC [Massilia yuzhufengensis]